MRFKSLGSGSTGNGLVVESKINAGHVSRVLVDCGFTQKELITRLHIAGLKPEDLSGIFITHEHSDHVGCAFKFAKRWGIPLWMSEGTAIGTCKADQEVDLHLVSDGQSFEIGGLRLVPFTVPHDAREPLQLRIEDSQHKLGLLTDLGQITDYVIQNIYKCDALVLESNHDSQMLAKSVYPPFLKKRVAGGFGHLSNSVAVEVLHEILHDGLQYVVAAHLSQQNNQPEIVAQHFAEALKCRFDEVCIADAENGTPWITIK